MNFHHLNFSIVRIELSNKQKYYKIVANYKYLVSDFVSWDNWENGNLAKFSTQVEHLQK